MNLVIRTMNSEDVPGLARMESEIFSLPWSEKAFSELLQHSYDLYLTAEADGILAGCAGLAILGEEGEIAKVMVGEKFRGKGIASALLGELMREATERGAVAFTLEVRRSNAPAIGLYEKFGFVSEGIRPGFYEKPVEDALIMWRRPTITKPTEESV